MTMTTMIRIKNKQRLITKIITGNYIAFSIYKYTVHQKSLTFVENE